MIGRSGAESQPHEDIYVRLRDAIDRMPIGYPATRSGVEIRLLKKLFTPLEASIALSLGMLPDTVARIHRRLNRQTPLDIKELEGRLFAMFRKGAISMDASRGPADRRYSLSQLAIGMFEYQVDRLSPDFAKNFEAYIDTDFSEAFFRSRTPQMRTIPIGKALRSGLTIAPYNDVRKILASAPEPIVVQNCVCRQSNDVLGEPCVHSDIRETCFVFGNAGLSVLERNSGRRIDRSEAFSILERAEEAGFVLQPQNSRSPDFICCCCGDCCHVLRAYKKLPRPAEHFCAPCIAVFDMERCTGCGRCADRCGMNAIRVDGKSVVLDEWRCLGCGACVGSCTRSAISLRARDKQPTVPLNQTTLYMRILRERFGIRGLLKLAARILTGRKL